MQVKVIIFSITDRLEAVLPASLYILVNTIGNNLADLLINELLRTLDRNPRWTNQVNHQYSGIHLLLQRPNDVLIVHKDRPAVRRI